MTEIDKFYIKQYALYSTPTVAFRAGMEEFGDQAYTAGMVRNIREKYRAEILAMRKSLMATIPILDVQERWAYLQTIVDGALEGEIVYDKKTGEPVEAKIDRSSALNALKLAHEMTQLKGTLNTEDEELVRSIVLDAYNTLREESTTRTDAEIFEEIINTLGDKVKPYLTEINVQTVGA